MASGKKAPPAPPEVAADPHRHGLPVRLLPHDWPFLYSVMPNGDLVVNQRLARAPQPRPSRSRVLKDADDALM